MLRCSVALGSLLTGLLRRGCGMYCRLSSKRRIMITSATRLFPPLVGAQYTCMRRRRAQPVWGAHSRDRLVPTSAGAHSQAVVPAYSPALQSLYSAADSSRITPLAPPLTRLLYCRDHARDREGSRLV